MVTRRIVIIGRGLIGGSIELALGRLDPRPDVIALDRNDSLTAATGADLIVLAAPISENIRILAVLASHVPGEALVTDTGSTKQTTVAAAEALPPRLRFIGGHPVAGAATSGREAAAAQLFERRPWILTPTGHSRAEDLSALSALIESLGAVVHAMDAAEHDRVLAYVSHLPQLTVSALLHAVGNAVGETGLTVAGAGLRDSTRLAGSPASLWADIAASNRDQIDAALDRLIATLQQLRDQKDEALPRIFREAARWKQVLDQGDHR